MLTFNLLVLVALGYVALLFLIAFAAEGRAARSNDDWLRSPLVYTLSLSIYCTAWTFYGAVGYAARSGLEFLTIYLGPSIVMVGWWWVVRKLVRIGRTQRITSIADLISSRYGKSAVLGGIVTVMAVIGVTPYIALQLQSISLSFAVFADLGGNSWHGADSSSVALWSAGGLALFTILFGTRNVDVNERHYGVIIAIALEAGVKLFALLAVGIFVVWGIGDGLSATLARIDASPIAEFNQPVGRWLGLIFLSGAAILCLPRMFHVMVVENNDERHLAVASWAFPLYLMLMSLFVIPIAVVGLDLMPTGSNPDMFVLTLPLSRGRNGLATLSFLGGFSSATSMVIMATIALATMCSNHIIVPAWLRIIGQTGALAGDIRRVVLLARRVSIVGVLALGYLYFRLSGGGASLSAMGLIAFAGLAQILPSMLGGIFWRGATRSGAITGLLSGFAVWLWTLFLPSFGAESLIPPTVLADGPWGISWLRPTALFGTDGLDQVVHTVVWSMMINVSSFTLVSLMTFPAPLERLQGAQFVNVFDHSTGATTWGGAAVHAEDLLAMTQRILGASEATALFKDAASAQGRAGQLPEMSPNFLSALERRLSGSVGAATAHAMVGQLTKGASVSVEDLMAVADEAAQILEYSNKLKAKSAELEDTALQLREANAKLTALSIQKDTFLSQISHELRTPMTSIRAFSEILRDGGASPAQQAKFAGIIQDEAIRLTRLLDDLLELSVLESGQVQLSHQEGVLSALLDRAMSVTESWPGRLRIVRNPSGGDVTLHTDLDRLHQVFINLIANAQKYCNAADPELRIDVKRANGVVVIDFVDNGQGIAPEHQNTVFEKFVRISGRSGSEGAGLGLAICREIMGRLGGGIDYLPGLGGAAFRVTLPA